MEQQFTDYGSWMNMLKGNYRKGSNTLRGILADPSLAAQMAVDPAAVVAIYGDVDYSDGTCLCANVIGDTDYAPIAFNRFLNILGVSDYDTWVESVSDLEVLSKLAKDPILLSIVKNSPKLNDNKRVLENDSWDLISRIGEMGIHSVVYAIGDTKTVSISDVGTMTMEIADFDHDLISSVDNSAKIPISFISKELLPNKQKMNNDSSNIGGFPSTYLAGYLNGTIKPNLPSDLKSVIKNCSKSYGRGNNLNEGVWSSYGIWAPTEYEVSGDNANSPYNESSYLKKYPIFTDDKSRVKKLLGGSSHAYWLSSAAKNASSFAVVSSVGKISTTTASNESGVCFGFCV